MKYENIETFNPASCISAKVMRVNRVTANIFRKYLKPFNITDSQLSILFLLSKKGGLNQKQMCEFTKLEKSSLNRNLERLYERNYLSRAGFPTIEITEKGRAFVASAIPEWEKAMAEIRQLLEEEGESALNLLHTKLVTKK